MARTVAVLLCLLSFGACAADDRPSVEQRESSSLSSASTTTTTAATLPPVALMDWTGPVEHLFFHTLVVRPELAFAHDQLGQGFKNYFVTVGEFRAILDQLYANGWTLVDIHRAAAGTIRVPEGRKPFVLSEDDVNYYDYSRPRGQGWRLVLDAQGSVKVEIRDDLGTRVTDDDLVPIVDAFVASHPDFSAEGAKGVIALTGYEGLFGERVDDPSSPDYDGSIERAAAIAARLKATGWTLASHSYGHIDLSKDSLANATRDTARWLAEAPPIIGPTDVYVYPFGTTPAAATRNMLRDNGFSIQCNIDPVPRLNVVDGVTVMSRRHVDGIAFAQQRRGLAPFFDVDAVEDVAARN